MLANAYLMQTQIVSSVKNLIINKSANSYRLQITLKQQLEIATLTDLKSHFHSSSLSRSIVEAKASYNDSMVAFSLKSFQTRGLSPIYILST